MEDTAKRCAHCQRTRPTAEFGISRKTKDGRSTYCKTCSNWLMRNAYRTKYGIIRPRWEDSHDLQPIPGCNPQNEMVVGKALKSLPYRGSAYGIYTKDVFTFSLVDVNDTFATFSIHRGGQQGYSYTFNRFSEEHRYHIFKMLYRDGIRLELDLDSLLLAKKLLYDV